jgi:uncharacterized protein
VTAAARVARGAVTAYQRLIAPFLPPACRFAPTCSEYTKLALADHGLVRGLGLALWRLLRCHPWHPGGYDPPPSARRA